MLSFSFLVVLTRCQLVGTMNFRLLCLAFLSGTHAEQTKVKPSAIRPLITTDVISDTATLIGDVCSQLRGEFVSRVEPVYTEAMEQGFKTLGVKERSLMKLLEVKTGVQEALIRSKLELAQERVSFFAGVAVEKSAPIRSNLYSTMSVRANNFVDAFETILPKYTGLIRRSPSDCFLFLLYIVVVVYISMRVLFTALSWFFSVFRCIVCCPCRMCTRSSGKTVPKKGKNKSTTKAEQTPAPKASKAGKKK